MPTDTMRVVASYAVLFSIVGCTAAFGKEQKGNAASREEIMAGIERVGGKFVQDPSRNGMELVIRNRCQALSWETAKAISGLEDLVTLDLREVSVDDHALEGLAKIKRLATLRLAGKTPGDEGLRHLKGLKLERLDFGCNLNQSTVGVLSEFRTLRVLDLSGADVGRTAYQDLRKIPQLEELLLRCNGVSDSDFVGISNCEQLRVLRIRSPLLTDKSLRLASNMKRLECLELWGGSFTAEAITSLRNVAGLRDLSIHSIRDETAFVGVLALENIESLDLAGPGVNDTSVGELKRLGRLRNLTLSSEKLTDAGVSAIQGLRHVNALSLRSSVITDRSVAALERMSWLRVLDIRGTSITESGLRRLRGSLSNTVVQSAEQ